MPFQSEKQRRFLHANHPEIAKRWEKEYSHGGILDINESEEIISDDGNDIELTAYNAQFDDPNDLSSGVRTLFQAKDGGTPRRRYFTGAYGGGGADSGNSGNSGNQGSPHGGGGWSPGVSHSGSTTSSPSTGSGRTRIQEDKQKEFQKQQIQAATKGTLSDPQEKYDTWEQELQDIPGTLEGPQASTYKNKANVRHTREIYEQKLANQKAKLKSIGLGKLGKMGLMLVAFLAMGVPLTDALKALPKTISVSTEDLGELLKVSYPVMKAKQELIEALGLQKGALLGQVDINNPNEMKSEIGMNISDITNEINDLTKTPDEDHTGGDGGIELPPQLGGPSTEEMATEYGMSNLERIRAGQAKYAAYIDKIEREKVAREDNPIVGTTEMDIIALGNSGGLANLFRVKNQ